MRLLLWTGLLFVATFVHGDLSSSGQEGFEEKKKEFLRKRLGKLHSRANRVFVDGENPEDPKRHLKKVHPTVNNFAEDIYQLNKRTGVADRMFQGDINLREEQRHLFDSQGKVDGRQKRQVTSYVPRWTNNTLNYWVDNTINAEKKAAIVKALAYISDRTCLTFVNNKTAKNRVRVFKGEGCYSDIGMGRGEQRLSLADGCQQVGTVAHEFTHALGIWHTQMRYDRDDYVTIDVSAVIPGKEHNFYKLGEDEAVNMVPYEYGSVMHYGADFFASNETRPSMLPKDPHYLYTIGSHQISFYDIQNINNAYDCGGKCANTLNCTNGGVQNPKSCDECLCPAGYAGKLCDERPSGCGEILTANSNWTSTTFTFGDKKNYQEFRKEYSFCNHWISAPEGKKIEIQVDIKSEPMCWYGCDVNGIEIKTLEDKKIVNPRICCKTDEIFQSALNPTPIISYSIYYYSTYVLKYHMGRTSGKEDLTDNDKRAIVVGRQNGLTMMTLAGMFGVTEAGISQYLKRQKAQDGNTKSQRTGRPRVTDLNDNRNILKTSRTNPRLSVPAIRREVCLISQSPPSVSTVKRRLNAAGIMRRRPVKKPLISEKNRAARVKWAKEHLNWTRQDWNKILWSDETLLHHVSQWVIGISDDIWTHLVYEPTEFQNSGKKYSFGKTRAKMRLLLWTGLLFVAISIYGVQSSSGQEGFEEKKKEFLRKRLGKLHSRANRVFVDGENPEDSKKHLKKIHPKLGEDLFTLNKRVGVADRMFQGDINLSENQWKFIKSQGKTNGRQKRQVTTWIPLWANNTVNYWVDNTIDEVKQNSIVKALSYISSRTCLNFVNDPNAENRIRVTRDVGCYAELGMIGGEQTLSLGDGCVQMGTVAHEFTHALGVWHTQMRSDRDKYVAVDVSAIGEDYRFAYDRLTEEEEVNLVPYEYGSMMHYGPTFFITNATKLSMVATDPRYQYTMGSRQISFYDIQNINNAYNCAGKCGKTLDCKNGGVQNPKSCDECICPAGYAGRFCDERPSGCGEILNANSNWTSTTYTFGDEVNFWESRMDFDFCNHWIKAPEGKKIEVQIVEQFRPDCSYGCDWNGIEIKTLEDKKIVNPRICCETDEIFQSALNPTPIISYNRYYFSTYTLKYRYRPQKEVSQQYLPNFFFFLRLLYRLSGVGAPSRLAEVLS
ncbi:unnamed protein product [Caenorhabditis auriculariae]|uniref:Metalloendopeptidase n=1 Tax=Caenorhabditis auriculariae TaxID=2777116 RepID=A0A8S1HEW3_9PELO|nr:unnamed protein product [Caenorhabditis auriculariae]